MSGGRRRRQQRQQRPRRRMRNTSELSLTTKCLALILHALCVMCTVAALLAIYLSQSTNINKDCIHATLLNFQKLLA